MEVDDKAWRLISALQADGRASLKELAEAVGLSVPATLERLRRLQEAGVVRGVHAGDRVLVLPEAIVEVDVRGDLFLIVRERDVHAVASGERDGGSTGLYL